MYGTFYSDFRLFVELWCLSEHFENNLCDSLFDPVQNENI